MKKQYIDTDIAYAEFCKNHKQCVITLFVKVKDKNAKKRLNDAYGAYGKAVQ